MRVLIVFAAAALAVSCGEKQPVAEDAAASPHADAAAPVEVAAIAEEDAWPDLFPRPTASYSGVYEFSAEGKTAEVTIAAADGRQRLEFPPGSGLGGAQGNFSQVMTTGGEGGAMTMWPEGEGAPMIATTMKKSDLGAAANAFGVDPAAAADAKRTGTDEIAGEKCAVYEIASPMAGEAPGEACVTRDGIVLRASGEGQNVMLAKSIDRGPQDAALFAPPAGYEIVDMGECMRIGAEMMAAMQRGEQPDEAKMAKCQALGEKMGGMYGE